MKVKTLGREELERKKNRTATYMAPILVIRVTSWQGFHLHWNEAYCQCSLHFPWILSPSDAYQLYVCGHSPQPAPGSLCHD